LAQTLRSYEKGKQWLWLFQTSIEWDVLACLLTNLSVAPKGDVLDSAWEAVDRIYEYWKTNGDTYRDYRWEGIEKLRSKALLAGKMIRSDPTRWEVLSHDNTSFEEREVMTAMPSQGSQAGSSKCREDVNLDLLSGQETWSLKCRSELPTTQPEFQEHPHLWVSANAPRPLRLLLIIHPMSIQPLKLQIRQARALLANGVQLSLSATFKPWAPNTLLTNGFELSYLRPFSNIALDLYLFAGMQC
jgi:hypothetical protein